MQFRLERFVFVECFFVECFHFEVADKTIALFSDADCSNSSAVARRMKDCHIDFGRKQSVVLGHWEISVDSRHSQLQGEKLSQPLYLVRYSRYFLQTLDLIGN